MLLPFNDKAIEHAADLVRHGQTVAVPTETVYGLAADATSSEAVARIYAAKGRPSFNPLIVHVLDFAAAEEFVEFNPAARKLAQAFWPGPLTLVLRSQPDSAIASLVTARLPTLAVRAPAHPAMRALLTAAGKPLAAPSANMSGTISPTRAEHVVRSMGERIPLVIDAGATGHGIESTIVAVTGDRLRLLRPGPIDAKALEQACGLHLEHRQTGTIEAPGQLESHYAPTKPLRLNATERRSGEWLIGFGPIAGDASLSEAGDMIEAAAQLFDLLHAADMGTAMAIAVAPIPAEGLGLAINDRLRRAAV